MSACRNTILRRAEVEHSTNYIQDRSSNFKHNVPSDIGPPAALSAYDYIQNERMKQSNKRRDWYLEAKDCRQVDAVSLRSNFANSRNYTSPTPVQEIDHHKGFLLIGVCIAAVIGGLMMLPH